MFNLSILAMRSSGRSDDWLQITIGLVILVAAIVILIARRRAERNRKRK